jgi:hypothetical protein
MYKNNILSKEEEDRSDYLMKLIEKKEKELEALKREMRAIVYKIEHAR